MRSAIILLHIFIFFLSLPGKSQEYYFTHFQVEKGLSNNTATCIIQDRKGFIWIGTKDGLDRFDGYNFKIFRNNPEDSSSLGNNSVWKLYEARNGIIWVGTEHGIYAFDPQTETFSFLQQTPKTQVRAIAEDSNGNIWMIIGLVLYRYQPATKKIRSFTSREMQQCTTLTISANDQLWVGNLFGTIGNYDPRTDHFTFYSVFSHSKHAVSNWIERIYDTGEGYFLIGTSNQGVKKFNVNDRTYEDILTYNEDNTEIFVRDFVKLKENEYWIATESGIYSYHSASRQFLNLKKNPSDPYALTDNAIYSFYKDKEGGIWIGTYFGGVNYYPKSNPLFEKYFPGVNAKSILGNAVREITADNNGNLWIGTEDAGLNKFHPQTGIFKNFKPDGTPAGIAHTNIHGLLCDGDRLWIGTFEHGLDIMDLKTEKIIRHFNAGSGPNDLRSNFIHSLYKSSGNRIWIGSSNGIYLYDQQHDHFITPSFFPGNAFYSSILETADGTIWAGTFQNGLHYYNPLKNSYGRLQLLYKGKDRLSENRVTFLREGSDHTLWIATEDGLFNIDLRTKTLKTFSTSNGLPSNLIYTITEDTLHRIWVTTSRGLALLDAQQETIRTFSKSNGLLSDQFNYSSVFRNKDGYIYAGSVKGMIRFNPATLEPDVYKPPVYITNFSVFNQPMSISSRNGPLYKSLLITDHITLPYNQSTFNIDFAAISYTSPDHVEYAYKLDGLDKNWNYIKTNRSVYFTNLPYGDYVFRVRSTNSSGTWQENEQQLKITITPPFWKTPLAYFIYTLLLIVAGYIAIRTYRQYLADKQKRRMQLYAVQKEKELVDAKIDFFTKVAHEIRTPLTLIKAPLEKITTQLNKTPQTEKYLNIMNRNTERLLALTNQLLDFRKAESEQFSLNFISTNVPELLTTIWNSFQPTAEEQQLQFDLSVPGEPFTAALDPEAFTKIISNLLDNALKYCHTKVTTSLQLQKEETAFIIRISNDGDPIPEEDRSRIFELFFRSRFTENISGAGIGLALAKSLIDLHGGKISLASTQNLVIFEIMFPLSIPPAIN